MTDLTAKFKFTDRGSNAVYDVLDQFELLTLGEVRIKPDPKLAEMRIEILDRDVQIENLTEAIETYTGACPEFNTLEPCLSEDCLMFRKALAGEKP
jgi:hypothetical protein